MNVNYAKFRNLGVLALICAGCAGGKSESDLPLIVAAKHSLIHASNDRIDLNEYTVRSVNEFGNARTSVIDRTSTDEYDVSVLRNLYKVRYWEVCYRPISTESFGAIYCYYLHKSDYRLLTAYRMK